MAKNHSKPYKKHLQKKTKNGADERLTQLRSLRDAGDFDTLAQRGRSADFESLKQEEHGMVGLAFLKTGQPLLGLIHVFAGFRHQMNGLTNPLANLAHQIFDGSEQVSSSERLTEALRGLSDSELKSLYYCSQRLEIHNNPKQLIETSYAKRLFNAAEWTTLSKLPLSYSTRADELISQFAISFHRVDKNQIPSTFFGDFLSAAATFVKKAMDAGLAVSFNDSLDVLVQDMLAMIELKRLNFSKTNLCYFSIETITVKRTFELMTRAQTTPPDGLILAPTSRLHANREPDGLRFAAFLKSLDSSFYQEFQTIAALPNLLNSNEPIPQNFDQHLINAIALVLKLTTEAKSTTATAKISHPNAFQNYLRAYVPAILPFTVTGTVEKLSLLAEIAAELTDSLHPVFLRRCKEALLDGLLSSEGPEGDPLPILDINTYAIIKTLAHHLPKDQSDFKAVHDYLQLITDSEQLLSSLAKAQKALKKIKALEDLDPFLTAIRVIPDASPYLRGKVYEFVSKKIWKFIETEFVDKAMNDRDQRSWRHFLECRCHNCLISVAEFDLARRGSCKQFSAMLERLHKSLITIGHDDQPERNRLKTKPRYLEESPYDKLGVSPLAPARRIIGVIFEKMKNDPSNLKSWRSTQVQALDLKFRLCFGFFRALQIFDFGETDSHQQNSLNRSVPVGVVKDLCRTLEAHQ